MFVFPQKLFILLVILIFPFHSQSCFSVTAQVCFLCVTCDQWGGIRCLSGFPLPAFKLLDFKCLNIENLHLLFLWMPQRWHTHTHHAKTCMSKPTVCVDATWTGWNLIDVFIQPQGWMTCELSGVLAHVCRCVRIGTGVKKEVHTMNQLLQEEHNAVNTTHTHLCYGSCSEIHHPTALSFTCVFDFDWATARTCLLSCDWF